jgi:fatty-acyl-CoA synthase
MNQMNMKGVTIGYGMTGMPRIEHSINAIPSETSPLSFQTQIHDPFTKRIETVGSIHPYVEVIFPKWLVF